MSRHESARECWLEKENGLGSQIEGLQEEKKALETEMNILKAQLEESKTDLETQMNMNNQQLTKVLP